MLEEQIFKTRDFYQATILMTEGLPLLSLEKSEDRFVVFCFSDSDFKAENIIEDYWAGKLKIDPKELIRNIKELKNRMYGEGKL